MEEKLYEKVMLARACSTRLYGNRENILYLLQCGEQGGRQILQKMRQTHGLAEWRAKERSTTRAPNYQEIQMIAKQIVKELGYYTKVADWNKKEYLKAKLRAALKNLLINVINGRAQYNEIEQLSKEIVNHAEIVCT